MLTNHPRIRLGIYLVGLGVAAAAATVAYFTDAQLGQALTTGAGILTAAALGVAAANTPPSS